MQVAPEYLLPPNVCFICEASRNPGEVWIDTQRTFDAGGFSVLNGRKYVCERCATELAGFFGLASQYTVTEAQSRASEAEGTLRAIRVELDHLVRKIQMLSTHTPSAVFDIPEEVPVVLQEGEGAAEAVGVEAGDSGDEAAAPKPTPKRASRAKSSAA